MNTTSVTLVLEQLETARNIVRALVDANGACGAPDARLIELMATLTTMEQEIRQIPLLLEAAGSGVTPLTLPQAMAQKNESLYYWEDE